MPGSHPGPDPASPMPACGGGESFLYALWSAIELSPDGPVVALNIPIGQWHTVRAL